MNNTIRLLHVEDNSGDAAYIKELLADDTRVDYQVELVTLLAEGLQHLTRNETEIVLLDLSLPDSTGMDTFLKVKDAAPALPVIVMTGLADESLATRAVQEGAQDYLLKNTVDADLLIRSIRYAIEREKLRVRLREAFDQIKMLKGLLPICAHCKNIRDDQGYWHQLEEYVTSHSEVAFTHGICPVCAEKFYADFRPEKNDENNG